MSDEIQLPTLVVKTPESEFRLRCQTAAWAKEYGGQVHLRRGHYMECPGLLLLSAAGPDTAVKSVRATLYQPDVDAEFLLQDGNAREQQLLKARPTADGKPVTYHAAVTKLAPGVIHLVALAKIPGLMPNLSDDHLWAELTSPRYTTPLLRRWVPWLKMAMTRNGAIVQAQGRGANAGVLKIQGDELDALVSEGVRRHSLHLVA